MMKSPDQYQRRVLIAVTGLAPQILTETIYALVKQQPSFVPTEVHVITTSVGAERIKLQLLSKKPGWYQRLVDELGITKPVLNNKNIHIIEQLDGMPLSDIRNPIENSKTADLISGVVQSITSDNSAAVHASIAGGRKTMGYYLGSALSLFGRNQDRLSHVLVSPDFEGHFDFFYPTKESRIIYANDADKTPLDTKQATLSLAEIPFVRLRHVIPEDIRKIQQQSYQELIDFTQLNISEPELTISFKDKKIIAAGVELELRPLLFSWYAMLALACKHSNVSAGRIGTYDSDFCEKFLKIHAQVKNKDSGHFQRTEESLRSLKGDFSSFIQEQTSRVRSVLNKALLHKADSYTITRFNMPRGVAYGLEIAPENITVID